MSNSIVNIYIYIMCHLIKLAYLQPPQLTWKCIFLQPCWWICHLQF